MPSYIYWGKECDIAKEITHKIDEFVIPTCPKCLGQMRKTLAYRPKKKDKKENNNAHL